MASGGSSRRPMSSESRSFEFGSDELLFSYDDYTSHKDQSANAKRSESTAKELHENRVGRPFATVYGHSEDFPRDDVISAVEICMKKHADNLMRNLEEIIGRLTQLELFCYKLERSVGEFRTDMIHGQSEADMKLKSLEKHVLEVQRSVQVIRDKQDLADAHKELTKLHLSQKETEDVTAAISDTKPQNDNNDMSNLQLTLALPNQSSSPHPIKVPDQSPPLKEPPLQHPPPASDQYIQNHATTYYTHHQPPLPNDHHIQHLQPELHYTPQKAQVQNHSHQPPPQQQPPFSQYQQQWPQPMLPQPSSSQSQVPRPQTLPSYPTYTAYNQSSITESFQSSSIPPPAPYPMPQPIGYGVTGSGISHPPPQHIIQRHTSPPPPPLVKSSFIGSNPYPPQPNIQAYTSGFAIDGSRASHPQNYQTNMNRPPTPQILRNHPYGEMIEKAVNMGYLRDHVVSVVKLLGETGQPFDFNALLDELNNGGPPRAWSR
ncbi:TGF-beta-activated kinase 1 and MAP3K7-binding protein 3-like [Phalaenopsis equestris]|uniref:TGF-beta-activated kinase 1 and MAP3K7-binding protein 3-like n=1 Tax=Phalaenopsis equestris TaxID=78828 RepID=UPI0009E54F96|nr:TGF-beta-activated kinase 1 and MAP3K7-binding protein 3-like [Phalaenopsis equestris]